MAGVTEPRDVDIISELFSGVEDDGSIVELNPFNPSSIKRKVFLLSIYYNDDEPLVDDPSDDEDGWWYDTNRGKFETSLKSLLRKHYGKSDIFDLAVEETKPWMLSKIGGIVSRLAYFLIRKKQA
mgnify:CR=1 FL=1